MLDDLIKSLIKRGVLETPRIIRSFSEVDRADFVPPEYKAHAYLDRALPIGYGQTISQPTTVAFMLERLLPEAGDKVLDVGSGSGWTTSLLANIVGDGGEVIGVEVVPELVEIGKNNLSKYSFQNAEIRQAGEKIGLSGSAPYDKILVSAASNDIPPDLVQQLKSGGRLVLPLRHHNVGYDKIVRVVKNLDGTISQDEFEPGFVFVPLK